MRDFRTEEQKEIPKSYYQLSEDQLSRLKTLLDRVVTKENLDITVPFTDAKRRKVATMLLAFFAIILSLTGFGTVILILAAIIMPPLLYFAFLMIATLYLWLIWGIPILGILFCNGFIRFSRQEETNAFVTVAYTILSQYEGVHRSSLSQEALLLKYFMSALKKDAESSQKNERREDFRISRLKQLLREINPTRKDLPESEWGTSKLALKWVVLASSVLSLVLGLRFLYVFFEGFPTISAFVWFILPFLGGASRNYHYLSMAPSVPEEESTTRACGIVTGRNSGSKKNQETAFRTFRRVDSRVG